MNDENTPPPPNLIILIYLSLMTFLYHNTIHML